MRFIIGLPLLFFMSFWGSSVYASSAWRCSGGLVTNGDSQVKVVQRCGEPSSRTFLGYGRRVVDGWYVDYIDDVPIEEWVYVVRRNRYYVLKFEDGLLRGIKDYYSKFK